MIWVSLIAGSTYFLLILFFFVGWEKLKTFEPGNIPSNLRLSVVVAMRNEKGNIRKLTEDIKRQTYPSALFELIIIDDHSTDRSTEEITDLLTDNISLYSLSNELTGKKAAIKTGIQKAKGEIIVLTDADCQVSENWLLTIAQYFSLHTPAILLAPVIGKPQSFFDEIQELEILSLQGSTAGSASIGHSVMSNSANLAFPKSRWKEVTHLFYHPKTQSGDDMFLLHAIKKSDPEKIQFLKSIQATVYTKLPPDLPTFFNQRKRWTSKARFYTDFDTLATAIIVFGVNSLIFFTIVYGIITGYFFPLGILVLFKCLIDLIFLFRVAEYFRQRSLLKWFPIVQSFYFLYILITVLASFCSPIRWKNRTIKY